VQPQQGESSLPDKATAAAEVVHSSSVCWLRVSGLRLLQHVADVHECRHTQKFRGSPVSIDAVVIRWARSEGRPLHLALMMRSQRHFQCGRASISVSIHIAAFEESQADGGPQPTPLSDGRNDIAGFRVAPWESMAMMESTGKIICSLLLSCLVTPLTRSFTSSVGISDLIANDPWHHGAVEVEALPFDENC